ncbi:MAG: FAD-binding oxidoreductase [Vicinamibacterales bacterium]
MIVAREARGDGSALQRTSEPSRLDAHLEDAAHVPGGHACALAIPQNEAAVARALADASQVLTFGAQSSLTGGATPRGDLLLSTERLRTLEVRDDGMVRVGAGVTIADLDARLRQHGRLYPPAPTWHGASVGGTIATNAAGAATFKYGSTRAWVEALTVVLASGAVLDLHRGATRAHDAGFVDVALPDRTVRVPLPTYRMPQVPKVSAGYYAAPGMDVIDLFIGSEGTLGVIVEATLRTLATRPEQCLVFATFPTREAAVACVGALRDEARRTWGGHDEGGLDVSAVEHMDARSLDVVREDGVDRKLGVALPADAAIGLLITVELAAGTSAEDTYRALAGEPASSRLDGLTRLVELLGRFGADDAQVAAPGDAAAAERLLALREAVPLGVNRRVGEARRLVDPRIEKTAADTIVPFEHVATMLDRYDEELKRRGLDGAVWGHISDGNVHPNVIPRNFSDVESGREAVKAFGREAIRLGGSPLAEHGVGRNPTKQGLLVDLYGEDGVAQMRRVKAALDPDWKLARGVIFPMP